ncbi:hypothetical protein BDR04DRAFT_1158486 [Suillus decipiens]|nr:hypothetical protein BDR04DRAFT_1158486 [Suillus decipiens]
MPPTCLVQCNSSCLSQPPILPGFRGPPPGNVKKHSAPTTSLVKSGVTAFVVESTSNLEVPKEPQSIPAVPELLHPKNIENAELNIQGSSLCNLIISKIRNGGDGPEVEVFPNISEEEYDYILNAIGCDDNLVCKAARCHRHGWLVQQPSMDTVAIPADLHGEINMYGVQLDHTLYTTYSLRPSTVPLQPLWSERVPVYPRLLALNHHVL